MDKEPLHFKEETGQIIGHAMEVLNTIGHGLYEKVYENALVVDLGLAGIPTHQQPEYPVIYKGVSVGKYIPDLICFEAVIVDAKTIEKISDHEVGKMINYLRITDCRVGLIVNFKRAKLEWKRVVI